MGDLDTNRLTAEQLRATVERARAHDPDAWAALYRHCYPRLVNFARRRLPSAAAEDAVSETMARALRSIDRFHWDEPGFDGWVYGILRNVIREQHRSTTRGLQLVERAGASGGRGRPTEPTPDTAVVDREERDALRIAFHQLGDDDREVLELRLVGELSAAEAGAALGKKPGAVRTAQSRAVGRLRTLMAGVTHG